MRNKGKYSVSFKVLMLSLMSVTLTTGILAGCSGEGLDSAITTMEQEKSKSVEKPKSKPSNTTHQWVKVGEQIGKTGTVFAGFLNEEGRVMAVELIENPAKVRYYSLSRENPIEVNGYLVEFKYNNVARNKIEITNIKEKK